ncbi:MAG: endonuclease [Elusimicrobia bacterium]|nr:endonuclease [Elusimicrobiota bacterium]
MTDRLRRAMILALAALSAVSPVSAQVRMAPVPVRTPGVIGGAAAGAAAAAGSVHAVMNPFVSPSLTLPASILPAPGTVDVLETLHRAALTEADLQSRLPGARAAAATPEARAASALSPGALTPEAALPSGDESQGAARAPSLLERVTAAFRAPSEEANGVKKTARGQTFAEMLASLDWRPGPAAPTASEAALPRDSARSAAATASEAALPRDSARSAAPAAARPDSPQAVAHFDKLFDGRTPRAPAAAAALTPTVYPTAFPGQSGTALREAVKAEARRNHRSRGYDETRSFLFTDADSVMVDGERGVVDAYSGIFVPGTSGDGGRYDERGDQDGDGYHETKGMNVEHIWPQSYFDRKLPMRSDLHHLMTTFQHPNGMRGRLPFGEVPDRAVEYQNCCGARMGAGVFEPPDSAKGRVARAMLYFMVRYAGTNIIPGSVAHHFWNSRIETFLDWNRRFPADQFERERNGTVAEFQGNRNLFVDDPTLADRIGAEAFVLSRGQGVTSAHGYGETARGSDTAGRSRGSSRKPRRR